MFTFFGVSYIGLLLICVALAIATFRYFMAAKAGSFSSPVTVNPGAAQRLISAALTGNKDAVLMAASEALHLQLSEGSIEQKLLQLGFADVQRQISDPNGKAPVIKAIAHFTGLTDQQVFDILKVELLGPPTPTSVVPTLPPAPATVAASLILCLALVGSAEARSPIAPANRWQPLRQEIQIDPAVFNRPVSIEHRAEALLPDSQYVSLHRESIYPDSYQPTQCQQGYYYQSGRWYPGKLVGRWFRNRNHPIARGAWRMVSFPFRWRRG